MFCVVYALFMAPFSEGGKVTTNRRETAGRVLQSNQEMFLTRTFIRIIVLSMIRGCLADGNKAFIAKTDFISSWFKCQVNSI